MKALTLSVIIPVYNESKYLRACLDALAHQEEQPHEVLVVDNNSTDDTVAIAESYPFVRVLRDTRQGQVFAQATGFDAATGDILGRIDADTVVPVDWTRRVRECMESHRQVLALTGDALPYDVPLDRFGAFVFRLYHHHISNICTGRTMILGANCALRKEGWHLIRSHMHYRRDIWEDYDMAIHLPLGTVRFVPTLSVGMSFRVAHKQFQEIAAYQYRAVRTIGLHYGFLRTLVFGLAWSTMIPVYPVTVVDRYLLRRRRSGLGGAIGRH